MSVQARFYLRSPRATRCLAERVAESLKPGQFLGLCGDLGAGKTTFTRGLTEALGCKKAATSPTFSLFQIYEGGRLRVFHADLYRVMSEDELFDLGWDETLEEFKEGLAVVEWADKFKGALPFDRLQVNCGYGEGDDERIFELEAFGSRSRELLESIQETEFE